MGVVSAEKVFADAYDEINFVVEKILAATKDRVILVIPQNSILLTSLVSTKVLAKQILLSKKLVVVVTEDDFGKQIIAESGLAVVGKVSDVTGKIWEQAQLSKERELKLLQGHEQKLLGERVETKVEEESMSEAQDGTQAEAGSADVAMYEKKRLEPKMVEVEGIEIFVGGDISQALESQGQEKEPLNEEVEIPEGRTAGLDADKEESKQRDFLGKDWTKATSTGAKGGKLIQVVVNWIKQPRVLAVFFLFLVFVIALPVFSIVNAFVTIDLTTKTADVPVSETITASTEAVMASLAELKIPAEIILSDDISRSEGGTASGTAMVGDPATGVVDVYNKTTEVIELPAGTTVKTVNSVGSGGQLVYLTTSAVTVPARTGDTPGLQRDVSVQSETFGTVYNLTGSASNTQFIVGNYTTEQVNAARILDFSGGSEREVTVVSEENINTIAESLELQVREAAFSNLSDKVDDGYILLAGTQQYEEVSVESVPELNQEAGTYDVTLIGKATGVVVKEDDLLQVLQELILRDQSLEVNFEVEELDIPEIANVVRQDGVVTFTLAAEGRLQSKVNTSMIQEDLAGLNISQVRDYLSDLNEIEGYEITYTASYLPEFLQIMPSDPENIKVNISNSND